MPDIPRIGDTVRFAPNPRWPEKTVEAVVVYHRMDPRPLPRLYNSTKAHQGWLDTRDAANVLRSVRPSRCSVVRRAG